MKCRYRYVGRDIELPYDSEFIIVPAGTEIPEWTGTYLGADNEPKYFKDIRSCSVRNGVAIRDIAFDVSKPSAVASFLYGKTAPRRAIVFEEESESIVSEFDIQSLFTEPLQGIVSAIERQIELNNDIIAENNARLAENNENLKILRKIFQSCNL